MKRVAVLGGGLNENEGAVAMTLVAIQLLKSIDPSIQVDIHTEHKDAFKRKEQLNLDVNVVIPDEDDDRITDILTGDAFTKDTPYYDSMRHSDLILDVVGDWHTDKHGIEMGVLKLLDFILPIKLGIKTMIFPQSIGPYNGDYTHLMAKYVIDHWEPCIAREKITFDAMKEWGVKNLYPKIVGDSAFLLETDFDSIETIFKEEKISRERPLVGLALSQAIVNFKDHSADQGSKSEEYVEKMTATADYLTEELGANVVFIAHVNSQRQSSDDHIMCKTVYDRAKNKDRITLLDKSKNYTPNQLKAVANECELFIGARMHANIGALSNCVPVVAVSYSHKTQGIMDFCGLGSQVVDVFEINMDQFKEMIKTSWDKRAELKKDLENRMPGIKEEIRSELDQILRKNLGYK